MKSVLTTRAPSPAGHYSQAIVHSGLIYVSGQLPINPESDDKVNSSIEDQTDQVLSNILAILEKGGSSKGKVIKATIYIADISLWDRVNTRYAAFFGEHRPARSIVPTKSLHFGFQIEMEVIAALVC